MSETVRRMGVGPFRPEQLEDGDPYELSNGHPVERLPQGGRAGVANLVGAFALATDPLVRTVGIDTGFQLNETTMRAPDIAVADIPNAPGWVKGVPPLAVEYADTGQDEGELALKIQELLAAGTRYLWVVRLVGPRRVEVHEPGRPVQVMLPGQSLAAPGVLARPLPVEALFDAEAAQQTALRNLLARGGDETVEALRGEGFERGRELGREEGRESGREEGWADALVAMRRTFRALVASRGLTLGPEEEARVDAADVTQLLVWTAASATATTTAQVFGGG